MPSFRMLLDRLRPSHPPVPAPALEPPGNDHDRPATPPVKVDEPGYTNPAATGPQEPSPRVDRPSAGAATSTADGEYRTHYGPAYTPAQRREDDHREARLAHLTDQYGPLAAARLMLQLAEETPEGADHG